MKKLIFILPVSLIIWTCGPGKKAQVAEVEATHPVADPVSDSLMGIYRSSPERVFDLVHTKLDLSFNMIKEEMNGRALITLTPHFFSVDTITLDAKGMDIRKVELVRKDDSRSPLKFKYDSLKLVLDLGTNYKKGDTIKVGISYTTHTSTLKLKGSDAISDARGLYFINPKGTEKDKPKQIWTQGETEAASCWFPTIDAPNQRMIQEICLEVDTVFETLSNGVLEYSMDLGNGKRTDCWKQSLPSAPYLSMIAVGDFAVVKDQWRDREVSYFVEKKYEPYARMIFGNTPEMMEFFSKKLGVDYPWEKYSQVVVRDYVSGAMENTSATIHGEFLQRTSRQLLDETNEDVISHELFHHWFGDMVTCESWSNLPLNESFATYGEYLWNEFKYGRDEADRGLNTDLNRYLNAANNKQVELIRFHYEDKEDMFDAFSYQKGGRVLHLLRKTIGEEAFFSGLNLYLRRNAFKSVEIHDLRLAFEEVTGQDLNWFFNQWFLEKGHPELQIKYAYLEAEKKMEVSIQQTQDKTYPLYRLPMEVDVYTGGKKTRSGIVVNQQAQKFLFPVSSKSDLVIVDAEKSFLGRKRDFLPIELIPSLYRQGPLFMDRLEALQKSSAALKSDSTLVDVIFEALSDPFWKIREAALKLIQGPQLLNDRFRQKAESMALNDPKSLVREAALAALAGFPEDKWNKQLLEKSVQDSSYAVIGAALGTYVKLDPNAALQVAEKLDIENQDELSGEIAMVYGLAGNDSHMAYFDKSFQNTNWEVVYYLAEPLGKLAQRVSPPNFTKCLNRLDSLGRNGEQWWIRLSGYQGLRTCAMDMRDSVAVLDLKIKMAPSSEKPMLQARQDDFRLRMNEVVRRMDLLRADEKEEEVKKYFEKMN